MTRAVIHQPYFLPWMGYFSKLVYAEKFVVLDNVNFSKRHFIDRVQVINSEGELIWLGMNIGEQYKNKCNEIEFDDKKRVENFIKTFYSAYSKARHFKDTISQIEQIVNFSFSQSNRITEINLLLIIKIIELLNLKMPEIILASQFDYVEDATSRVITLMKKINCDTLITGSGGSLDKHDTSKISEEGISIYLQDYYDLHPNYYQTRRTKLGFAKGLSIVDCIFNEGLHKTKELLYEKSCEPLIYKKINN